jgi:AbrB family looped-hinge helix DNA binding protein
MPQEAKMTALRSSAKIAANGRLVLPREVRNALGIEGATKLAITVEDGAAQLTTIAHGLAKAQAIAKKYVTDKSIVDEFLAERERD